MLDCKSGQVEPRSRKSKLSSFEQNSKKLPHPRNQSCGLATCPSRPQRVWLGRKYINTTEPARQKCVTIQPKPRVRVTLDLKGQEYFFKRYFILPWPVRLSCLDVIPQTKRSLVQFPLRLHAQVVGLVPSWGHAGGNQLMFLSLSLPLPSPLCK